MSSSTALMVRGAGARTGRGLTLVELTVAMAVAAVVWAAVGSIAAAFGHRGRAVGRRVDALRSVSAAARRIQRDLASAASTASVVIARRKMVLAVPATMRPDGTVGVRRVRSSSAGPWRRGRSAARYARMNGERWCPPINGLGSGRVRPISRSACRSSADLSPGSASHWGA